jgi:hypothetical protein
MGRIVRSKREWVCSNCKMKYIKWNGSCYRGCKFTGTLSEVSIVTARSNNISTKTRRNSNQGSRQTGTVQPATTASNTLSTAVPKPSSGGTAEARRLRRRAKDSERDIAKRMVAADGPDPAFRNIASSSGRIGFITGMRVDAISRNYVTENKNRKMPTWLIDAWVLINQRAVDFQKHALLHVDPPNMPRDFVIQGGRRKLDTLAIITQSRHEELILNEKMLNALLHEISNHKEYISLQNLFEELQKNCDD